MGSLPTMGLISWQGRCPPCVKHLIALLANIFTAKEVQEVVDPSGQAMVLDVVADGGSLAIISAHEPGSGTDLWVSKATSG